MDEQIQTSAEPEIEPAPLFLTVIVPARNEADVLGACLESLVAQSEVGFALGSEWELLVIDDASTDATRQIAQGFAGVTVLEAPALDTSSTTGFTGKNNACWAGAQAARGSLLLFTDADTLHEPGNLSRARHELEKYKVALLSYSPQQLVTGFAQRILMPLVFAELATAYPMNQVNDPANALAAANGQFLMVVADAYFAVGGHRGVGRQVLEDVTLARAIKRGRNTIRFRYAPDALSARMYRSTDAMMEGWTKNLALLFANPIPLLLMRLLDILLLVCIPLIALEYYFPTNLPRILLWIVWARVLYRFYARVAKSNFPAADCAFSILGLPLFLYLLLRSYFQVKISKSVSWKGRTYKP